MKENPKRGLTKSALGVLRQRRGSGELAYCLYCNRSTHRIRMPSRSRIKVTSSRNQSVDRSLAFCGQVFRRCCPPFRSLGGSWRTGLGGSAEPAAGAAAQRTHEIKAKPLGRGQAMRHSLLSNEQILLAFSESLQHCRGHHKISGFSHERHWTSKR